MADLYERVTRFAGHDGASAPIVLVALDDEADTVTVAAALRDAGVPTLCARDVSAAETLASSVPALDLAILDAPRGRGASVDLVGRLRALHPSLRTVCVVEPDDVTIVRAGERRVARPCAPAVLAQVALEEVGRREPGDARAESLLARLEARVATPALRSAMAAWRDARRGARLPRLSVLGQALAAHDDHLFVAAALPAKDGAMSFRFLTLGDALRARSASPEPNARATFSPEEQIASLAETYQRAARTGLPTYERVSYGLGSGAPVTFERLVLPASTDGLALTHLVGIVLFHGALTDPQEQIPA